METSVLVTASIATLLLVGVLFFAAILIRRWRQEVGAGDAEGGPRDRASLEAIYAEFLSRQASPEAAAAREEARAVQDEARQRLADAEGLLERLRREAPAPAGGNRGAVWAEAESELRQIRACLNRGDSGQARDRARELTLRLAGEIARLGPAG